uniref:NHL domain protein Brain Tumour n=1 Tax=Platynereis dumerilii TaxID=6359 RepID=L0PRP0_PLADU|nr:NHL domain protein Brain Tumour [Platynereis dumerilii]
MSSPTLSTTDTMSLTSNSSEGDIENSLNTKCSLCNETYSIPKVLPCFHTFCQPCLEKIIETPDKLSCPECHQETFLTSAGIAAFPPDFAVNNVLEASVLEGATLSCTGCKSKHLLAVARCFDCPDFLCQDCERAHQYMKHFDGHRVISLGELQNNKEEYKVEKPVMCKKHRQEMLRFFCHTCNIPICKECTLVNIPKATNTTTCQNALAAKYTPFNTWPNKPSLEHSSNRLQIQYHKAQNEINETYNFYRSMLEERKQEALKELDGAYNAKQSGITNLSSRMQEYIEKLYQGVEFIDRMTKHASSTEVLIFKKMLDTNLQKLTSFMPDTNSVTSSFDLEFVSNYQAIQVGIRNTFGYVRTSSEMQSRQYPQPIARPNGFSAPPRTITPPNPLAANMPNPMVNCNNLFDPTALLLSKNNFPSSGSLTLGSFTDPIISNNLNPYEKWSNGGLDLLHNGDVFSTSTDPVIDLTSKLISANIYPPKSQIKRQKMIYHCKFGEFGVMEGQFTEPSGVAVNAQNDIIVQTPTTIVFRSSTRRVASSSNSANVESVTTSGDIVVTERSPTHQVQIYNQYGQFVRKFGANILQHPRGVTVDNKGRIIIVECKVMRVIIFSQMGDVLHKFGCSKHLEFPNGVVVNDKEEIFISDNRAHCVKVFSYQGVFLRQIGGEGITNYPIGVGINPAGEILVADNHNNFNLTIFTQDGQMVSALESKVKHAQCFDVALMDEGSIVLASKDYRLYIYRYMQMPPMLM